jgi:hypothetical protein
LLLPEALAIIAANRAGVTATASSAGRVLQPSCGKMPMQCRSCRAWLNEADNYCRKCGAAVEMIEVIDASVVRRGPAQPAPTLREAALPMLTQGAAVIVAGTVLRMVVKHLIARQLSGRGPFGLQRRPGTDGAVVEELIYYRRVQRSS